MDKLADDLITAVADREQYAAEAQTLAVWLENRELGILEFIEANPMQGMKLPKAQYERIAPPTPAAAAVILAVAKGHVYRAVMLRIFLGVRIGPTALFRLKWQDLDFERRTIREWSAVKNKNMPFRDVPIRENLLEEMKVWVRSDVEAGHEFIVHFKGKPIATASLARHQAGGGYRLAHAPIRFVSCVSPAPCKSFPDIMPSCAQDMCPKNQGAILLRITPFIFGGQYRT